MHQQDPTISSNCNGIESSATSRLVADALVAWRCRRWAADAGRCAAQLTWPPTPAGVLAQREESLQRPGPQQCVATPAWPLPSMQRPPLAAWPWLGSYVPHYSKADSSHHQRRRWATNRGLETEIEPSTQACRQWTTTRSGHRRRCGRRPASASPQNARRQRLSRAWTSRQSDWTLGSCKDKVAHAQWQLTMLQGRRPRKYVQASVAETRCVVWRSAVSTGHSRLDAAEQEFQVLCLGPLTCFGFH